MAYESAFIPLVKHELKRQPKRRSNRCHQSRKWLIAYIGVILLIVIGYTTYLSLNHHFELNNVWYFTWGLPFMVFGMSIGRVHREWQNDTVGWWLSLPYKRTTLVTTKFLGSLIKTLMIIGIIYSGFLVFGIYVTLINSDISLADTDSYFISGLGWFIFIIGVAPIASAFGTFMGIIAQSKARPIMPLMWVFIWAIFPILGSTGFFNDFGENTTSTFPFSYVIIYPIIASWILAFIMIRISAYLLDRQLAL